MKKLFISSPESCAGCRTCELLCSLRHEKVVNPELARITVVKLPLGNVPDIIAEPVFCRRCGICVKECPEGALSFANDTWRIEVDKGICTGCSLCVEVCPFGAIRMMHPKANVPLICDLCGGDPICAEFCPTGTLVFKEESQYTYGKAMQGVKRRHIDSNFEEKPPPPRWKEMQFKYARI